MAKALRSAGKCAPHRYPKMTSGVPGSNPAAVLHNGTTVFVYRASAAAKTEVLEHRVAA